MNELSSDAPAQSYPLLRKFVPKRMQPLLRGVRKRWQRPSSLQEPYRSVFPFTQSSLVSQENLLLAAEQIEKNQIPGAVVECGVLDGGTAALMAFGTAKSGRAVHLFDAWQGLPDVTEKDGNSAMWVGQAVGSPRRVNAILRILEVDPARVIFHQGWFQDTFPKAKIGPIALLHIDCDFYDAVRLSLETWEPHVSPGGFIQFDDYYSFIGCKRAVDEYLVTHPNLKLETFRNVASFIHKST